MKNQLAFRVGVVLALAVCSAVAAFGAPLPRSLLTTAQVGAVLDVTVGAGKPLGAKSCDWTAPGQPTGITAKKVTVTMLDERGFAAAKMPIYSKGITKTSVTGVGDEAIFGTTGGLVGTLAVKKGNVAFVVHVYGFPLDQIEAKEKNLALEILANL
jgi:hypothetical protein